MNWDPATLLHGYAIFLRAGAFLFLLPMLVRPVPVLIRVAAAFLFAVLLVPLTEPSANLVVPGHWIDLVVLSIRELFIGFLMGYSVQIITYLCQIAGRLISMEMGLMQSNLFNPMAGEQGTVLATGMTSLSLVLVFALGIHHLIIYAFLRSLSVLPAGSVIEGGAVAERVVNSVGQLFLLSLQMSAPLIAVNFNITLAFAILGRAVPNMNVLILSFGVRIMVGFIVLILVFAVLVQFLIGTIHDTPERMLQFLPFN